MEQGSYSTKAHAVLGAALACALGLGIACAGAAAMPSDAFAAAVEAPAAAPASTQPSTNASAKSSFKPVAMTKLQCYKGYRKYMTTAQFKKAYKKAVKLVSPAGNLSKTEKLQYVTSTLREFFDKNMTYEAKKAHYNDPYGYLCLKRASCAGAARTTRLCLNILGIKAEHVNENKWTHQWCRVKVDKSYWIADPYGLYCGKEPGARKHPYL